MQGDAPGRQIDRAIGASLKELRQSRKQSARRLAEQSGISAAMVSRIENGLVSPSIDTLAALAEALQVPIVSLFREARTDHTDYTLVRHGEGLKSTRIAGDHSHKYVNLALHSRTDLRFQARRVTLLREGGQPPTYVGHGVVFVQALEGEAIYRYGEARFTLVAGDSISVDAELNHGFVEVLTPEFVFLTVQAERP
ncbi:helix-turn-helix domain-containing protein [Ruegeria sp. 2012CJ41-6]|uniref:Helix-turn-helix domain-containing protein n=1 Tax=Ruegeria spongiae TaxID=2942209 RepID=A0ABT0Q6H3_9RHOB|nr:helix-turn-helix transcriptional regulator [Ruegeria spongiae]MCL6285440.1 helix-turn-helix domain-containing protein [Ruegeria spongiae]